jgi:hypothetical protein
LAKKKGEDEGPGGRVNAKCQVLHSWPLDGDPALRIRVSIVCTDVVVSTYYVPKMIIGSKVGATATF